MNHDRYDNDILKTLKSIDMSLKSIAKSLQMVISKNSDITANDKQLYKETASDIKNRRDKIIQEFADNVLDRR